MGLFEKKPRRGRHARPRTSRGLWLAIAILLAGFSVFLLIITKPQKTEPKVAPPPINSIKKPSPEKTKPKFEFYNILPQKQIAPKKEIPKAEPVPTKPAAPTAVEKEKPKATAASTSAIPAKEKITATEKPTEKISQPTVETKSTAKSTNTQEKAATNTKPTASTSSYWLQMGAFLIFDDADALKAQVAFSGFPANIQTASVDGKTWFRVRSGPFTSEEEAKKTQAELKDAGINSKMVTP